VSKGGWRAAEEGSVAVEDRDFKRDVSAFEYARGGAPCRLSDEVCERNILAQRVREGFRRRIRRR